MHALEKHPLVDCDLEEAALWYDQRNPSAALRLIDAAQEAMRTVALHPLRFSKRFEDVRHMRLRGFPYCLYFQLFDDRVYVLAIAHDARDLASLLRRRKVAG